ncbi:homocysteine S-methyltransferase [Mumia sp. ZJ1417]|uniref:homocysteine S-methyltransferase n=1 Tax=Mumia sp. ZJ1417 TaxID=2708082 RepID=UPI0014221835|nr:homocysteine S-methyltransferase [Mumia sp. ZJ1417]QMW67602.1 homocysteine S-methyltransferase [Mumia sp. ZJ1417]
MTTLRDTWADRDRLVVLDGALATELERHGADLSSALWSASLLRDDPALIAQVHRDYLEAGADVIITASYQATVGGFGRLGLPADEAERLIRSAVTLARQTRDAYVQENPGRRPVVAASVGPYGAALADGSEYRGDYGLDVPALRDFHRERLHLLADAGPEVLACETIPSALEAAALADLLDDVDVPAWVTFSARDDTHLSDGTPVAEVVRLVADHGVAAVGINCTPLEHIAPLVDRIAAVTDLPIAVYPNSGEVWDAAARRWTGTTARGSWATWVGRWRDAGANLVGGCCRTTPADVAEIAATRV